MDKELIEKIEEIIKRCNSVPCDNCGWEKCCSGNIEYPGCMAVEIAAEIQAIGYFKAPCRVGDLVWCIRNYKGKRYAKKGFVREIRLTKELELIVEVKYIGLGKWGKKVFPTKETAEKAIIEEVQNG